MIFVAVSSCARCKMVEFMHGIWCSKLAREDDRDDGDPEDSVRLRRAEVRLTPPSGARTIMALSAAENQPASVV